MGQKQKKEKGSRNLQNWRLPERNADPQQKQKKRLEGDWRRLEEDSRRQTKTRGRLEEDKLENHRKRGKLQLVRRNWGN